MAGPPAVFASLDLEIALVGGVLLVLFVGLLALMILLVVLSYRAPQTPPRRRVRRDRPGDLDPVDRRSAALRRRADRREFE